MCEVSFLEEDNFWSYWQDRVLHYRLLLRVMNTIDIQSDSSKQHQKVTNHFICLKKFWRGLESLCFLSLSWPYSMSCNHFSSSSSIQIIFKILPIRFFPGQKSGRHSWVHSTFRPVPHFLSPVASANSDWLSSRVVFTYLHALYFLLQISNITVSSIANHSWSTSSTAVSAVCLTSIESIESSIASNCLASSYLW